MLVLTAAEINTWIASLIWPLTRILGLITASPLFGNARIPQTVQLSLGVLMTIAIAPWFPRCRQPIPPRGPAC
ncbi:flagellar biosynthetic protein FliR [Pseudoduganella chitinolytica]|uniref:flagellar biosynthetic protein FliR n=1 Tax=Pseudoduganella chitinolytica TaxID=34070 RepID=UPI0027D97C55|nr:flagellar biosynthetic protein FliR [Pseudoduganella chitinolytica]